MKSQVVFSREPRPALPTNLFFCVVDIFHVVSVAFPGGERLVADCARGDILLVLLLGKKETLRKLHDNSDYRPIKPAEIFIVNQNFASLNCLFLH